MRSNRWCYAMILAVLFPVLASLSCSESDDLAPQTQSYLVSLSVVNPDPRFQQVEIQFGQVSVRPIDPDANASLTADGLGLLSRPILMSSLDTEAQVGAPLTNNVYGVFEIELTRLFLKDFTPDPNPTTCIEFFNTWSDNSEVDITPDDFGTIPLLMVENGGSNSLNIIVDSTAYAAAFVESWPCAPCSAGWCRGTFDKDEFTARASEFLTFE